MDDDVTEINAVEEMGLRPWIPTLKYNVVEITSEQISGRGFELGEEPERYVGRGRSGHRTHPVRNL